MAPRADAEAEEEAASGALAALGPCHRLQALHRQRPLQCADARHGGDVELLERSAVPRLGWCWTRRLRPGLNVECAKRTLMAIGIAADEIDVLEES